jgi:enterochelin esterase-like enzyme
MKFTRNRSGFKLLMITSVALLLSGLWGCKKDPDVNDKPFVRLLENEVIQSNIFNREINYAVLLPENYNTSTDSFPVVYLLHGYGDDHLSWSEYGLIKYYSDLYTIETGPMIFVMPQGFNSYYVNRYNGSVRYMDFFTTEFVPHIDSAFRTIKDKEHRAVMGYSMGGYGAIILPSKNPDIFKTGVSLSMSFRTDSQYVAEPQWVFDSQWGPIFGGIGVEGPARLTNYFLEYSPFHYFGVPGGHSFAGLNLYLDCGDDEETLSETNGVLHNVLRDLNIPHEYRMNNGGHSWDYWHKELPEALRYIGFAFQQRPFPPEPDKFYTGQEIPSDQVMVEQLEGTGITFRVVLPEDYADGSKSYPVIMVIHDRNIASHEEESQKLFSLLTKNMMDSKLPASLIVEIPMQVEAITYEYINNIFLHVRENYRTIEDSDHAIMMGNKQGGYQVYHLMPACGFYCKTFMLFDADLADNTLAFNPDASFYLDISDQGTSYKGYHSLYMSLRQNQIYPEYRVRNGTGSHDSFLYGLDDASGFMKDHLK